MCDPGRDVDNEGPCSQAEDHKGAPPHTPPDPATCSQTIKKAFQTACVSDGVDLGAEGTSGRLRVGGGAKTLETQPTSGKMGGFGKQGRGRSLSDEGNACVEPRRTDGAAACRLRPKPDAPSDGQEHGGHGGFCMVKERAGMRPRGAQERTDVIGGGNAGSQSRHEEEDGEGAPPPEIHGAHLLTTKTRLPR